MTKLIEISALLLATLLFSAAPATSPSAFPPVPDQANLHNAHVVTEKVISGAQPEGEESFKALQALGVKTIISVDGAKPDVALAQKYGMRYVHLPIGYDGVPAAQGKAIAKAIDEMPGKIYIHCHHGKHRSAAAVAVACVFNGSLRPEQAESVLKTFGTGANYKGLWQAARDARRVDQSELRSLEVEYVESAKIADFAATMVQVDRHWDHIKLIQKAGWKTPPDHPDLDPAHEVLQVQEHLTESRRLESTAARPDEFKKMLEDGEAAAKALSEILRTKPVEAKNADAAFERVAASCTSCHHDYRD